MIGRTLGHYVIAERLGAGGMGEVYRARDTRLERDVAIKILAGTAPDTPEARRQLRKEALALSQLNHPNVAVVHDFDEVDDLAFVVMELVPGQDVRARLGAGPLPEDEVIRLGIQAAEGLQAAHTAGVVHRDLKPANLRITPEGRLKILDFGVAARVASAADPTRPATETARFAGTLPYMAPEQLRGHPPDPRADLHAICAVLYELSTGTRPFDATNEAELIDQILNDLPLSPRTRNPQVSSGLEAILLKGLEKAPERRYQSAKEIGVDLERLRTPATTPRGGRTRPAARAPGRRTWSTVTAAILLFAAVGGGWVLWRMTSVEPVLAFAARDWILVADFENQTGEAVFDASLSTAFGIGLAQSTHANIVSRARVDEALRRMGRKDQPRIDEPIGREIAVREGFRGLVVPGISRIGQTYAVSARLVDPGTGTAVRSYLERSGHADEVLEALDRIGNALRRDLGESLVSIQTDSRPLPQVTTRSLDALQSHADGMALWRKGQYKEAVVQYERAVERDPEFAMAHAALGTAYLSFIYNETVLGRQHLDRALALADRTTDRERMYLNATYAARLGDKRHAIELYKACLFRYPDDQSVRMSLANLLRELRRFDEAATEYQDVIRMSPANASAHINLATALSQADRHVESLASYDRAFALEPTWKAGGNLNHEYGMELVVSGRRDEARTIFALTLGSPEERPRGLRSLALLNLLEGRYKEAEPQLIEAARLNEALKRPLSAGRDLFFLSQARQGLGDRVGQMKYLGRATTLYEQSATPAFLVRAGSAYVRSGSVDEARRLLAIVKALPDDGDPERASSIARLEGEILVASGQAAAGIERLEWADAQPGATPEQTKEALALAYERAGYDDQAIAAFEALLGSTVVGWEPQQPWLIAHHTLGTLYLEHGRTADARSILDRLLSTWQNADSNLPLLSAARRLREAAR